MVKKNVDVLLIAATPVDTSIGVALCKEKNLSVVSVHLSSTPKDQTLAQLDPAALTQQVYQAIDLLTPHHSFKVILIYCNSLAGSLNIKNLTLRYQLPVITPFEIYAHLAAQFNSFGILAANNQALAHIEKFLLNVKPNLELTSFSSLALINAIEHKITAETLFEKYHLLTLGRLFDHYGCEAIILGCTHFSYLYNPLNILFKKNAVQATLIEPSHDMMERLLYLI